MGGGAALKEHPSHGPLAPAPMAIWFVWISENRHA